MAQKYWKQALEQFLQQWLPRPEVIGALVCGSYVTGNPSPRSDIDVHLVLSDDIHWRERGNRVVGTYMIEYFANPPHQIRQYFREDHAENRPMAATQFVTGDILHDPNGMVARLQTEAQAWLDTPFARLSDLQTNLMNYGLWDALEKLRSACERQHPEVRCAVHHFVCQLVEFYARYLRVAVPSVHQLSLLWQPERAYQKYRTPPFPDATFAQFVKQALEASSDHDLRAVAEQLYTHVMHATGGFTIDGWALRSPVTTNNSR